ncbi:hypothetical protein ACFSTJ_19240 [Ottowia pentelensis]|uniref:hypothetical protein n=1 Tax=Ottowia pentelensis TaxID=511108 RepID=UPI00362908A1
MGSSRRPASRAASIWSMASAQAGSGAAQSRPLWVMAARSSSGSSSSSSLIFLRAVRRWRAG